MAPPADGLHAFTVRVEEPLHAAAKAFATLTGSNVNELVGRALREFLVNHGSTEEVEAMAKRAREQYREAVQRLSSP